MIGSALDPIRTRAQAVKSQWHASRRAPQARPTGLRLSPEDGPDAPPPRGHLRGGRPSHRRLRWVWAGSATHRDRRARTADVAGPRSMTGRRPARAAGQAGDPAVCSTGNFPSPTAIPDDVLGVESQKARPWRHRGSRVAPWTAGHPCSGHAASGSNASTLMENSK